MGLNELIFKDRSTRLKYSAHSELFLDKRRNLTQPQGALRKFEQGRSCHVLRLENWEICLIIFGGHVKIY